MATGWKSPGKVHEARIARASGPSVDVGLAAHHVKGRDCQWSRAALEVRRAELAFEERLEEGPAQEAETRARIPEVSSAHAGEEALELAHAASAGPEARDHGASAGAREAFGFEPRVFERHGEASVREEAEESGRERQAVGGLGQPLVESRACSAQLTAVGTRRLKGAICARKVSVSPEVTRIMP